MIRPGVERRGLSEIQKLAPLVLFESDEAAFGGQGEWAFDEIACSAEQIERFVFGH